MYPSYRNVLMSLPVDDSSLLVPGIETWLGNVFAELNLPGGIGVSVIDHHAQEVLFASSRDIRFDVTVDPHLLTAHLKIGYAQVCSCSADAGSAERPVIRCFLDR
jgi:hypothetical protein